MQTRTAAARQFVMVAILLLSVGLSIYRIDAQSFWNDEGNSARLSERSVKLIIEGTASDIHPPLYYLMLSSWRGLVGESEFSLRLLSAFAGLLTVATAVAVVRAITKRAAMMPAAIAALVLATHPAMVYYSQEARMYAMLALFTIFSSWILICLLGKNLSGPPIAAYILTVAAGLYTHYFFPITILLHNLMVLAWLVNRTRSRGRDNIRSVRALAVRWTAVMFATLILYLPWTPIFLRQSAGRDSVRESLLGFLTEAGRWLAFGATLEPDTALWPLIGAAILLFAALAISRRHSLYAFAGLLVPVAFMYIAGTTRPEFYKFMLTAVPFYAILIGLGWSTHGRKSTSLRFILIVPLLLLIVGNILSLGNLYLDPQYARANYRGIASRIEAEHHANAGIILSAPNQWEVFTYYHRAGAPVYPIPIGYPSAEAIQSELTQIAARHDTLYAIFWGELQQDPDGVVERWLDANTFKAADEWIGDVRFVTYAVPTSSTSEMAHTTNVRVGDSIHLRGYTLVDGELSPGDIVRLTLFLETDSPIEMRYKVFLHLMGEDDQLVAQQDGEPGGGSLPTSSWRPGDLIVDNHGIPLPQNLPAGDYTIYLGFYDPFDPSIRLPINSSGIISDAYPLETIVVR